MLAVDTLGVHQPKRDPRLPRFFDQRPGQVRFGVKGGIRFPLGPTTRWSVRFDPDGHMASAIRKVDW
jgi:hypothetical protein